MGNSYITHNARRLCGRKIEHPNSSGTGLLVYNSDTKKHTYLNAAQAMAGIIKEVVFPVNDNTNTYKYYRITRIGGSGAAQFSFRVPIDFIELVDLKCIFTPINVGALGSNKNIDLYSNYGKLEEAITQHSEADIVSVYDLGDAVDVWKSMDISHIFSELSAGDFCGFHWKNKFIGGAIQVHSIVLTYV